jgi:hypothetical protein
MAKVGILSMGLFKNKTKSSEKKKGKIKKVAEGYFSIFTNFDSNLSPTFTRTLPATVKSLSRN